jgi:putative ABC transport system substrate-binding protein
VKRRQFVQGVGAAGLALVAGCGRLPGQAQAPARVARVGFLVEGPAELEAPPPLGVALFVDAFREGLRDLGYVEDQNIVLVFRMTTGGPDRLQALAAALVQLPVDLIVTTGTPGIDAAQHASSTIPIVFSGVVDPVEMGFVASLARPGGNLTGLTEPSAPFSAKRLQLLTEVVPGMSRVAVFWDPTNRGSPLLLREVERAAQTMGVAIEPFEMHPPDDIDRAFDLAVNGRNDAVYVLGGARVNQYASPMAAAATRSRMPATHNNRQFVVAGGLMAYLGDRLAMWRRAASYVDRILKGAQPAHLPVEQPTRFELAINLGTARALGLTIPPPVLAQATEVIP